MLARMRVPRAAPAARPAIQQGLCAIQQTFGAQEVQTRSAATLKTLQIRMKAINNMKKITKAMKMVATAKFKKDMKNMENGVPFGKPVMDLMERLPRQEKTGPITYLAVTSDKGLCGGVNSAVAKQVRLGLLEEEAKGNTGKITVLGGKGVATMKRLFADRFNYSFEEVSKSPWTFATASFVAERLIASKPNRLKIVSNEFKSMVAYDTVVKHTITLDEATTMDKAEWSKAMDVYSFEPSIYEVWADLHEFYYGCAVYAAYLESATTEKSCLAPWRQRWQYFYQRLSSAVRCLGIPAIVCQCCRCCCLGVARMPCLKQH